jgi:hypothetical protein
MKMRKKECSVFCTVLLVAALCLLTVPAAHANLVTNGSFNTDLSGWAFFGTVSWNSSGNPGGSVAFTTTPVAYLEQSVSTIAGQSYKVSFDLYGLTGTGEIRVDIGNSGQDFNFTYDQNWHSYSFDYSAPITSDTFYFLRFVMGSSPTTVLLDNVNVVQTSGSNVPIPGAAFLFAPALLGLVGLRRRFSR